MVQALHQTMTLETLYLTFSEEGQGPRTRAGILLRLQQLENLNDKLLPSKTQHRSRMGLDRKVTVTTPDQSISVSPCTMTDGFCN